MRRNIRALGEIAEVTEIALIHYFGVIGDSNAIDFHGVTFIDQVEQGGEGVTQAHTAAAAVANIVDPFQFLVERVFVPEFGVVLIKWVSSRRVETAFSTILCHGKAPD
jgi:hypothetical protein